MRRYEHWRVRSRIDQERQSAETASGYELAPVGRQERSSVDAAGMRPADDLATKRDAEEPDASELRRVIAGRARMILKRPIRLRELASDEAVHSLVKEVEGALEKIHQEPNFLPAAFLRTGAECARAVCRIPFRTAEGAFVGSGFLVAPGIVMTNNHVLKTREIAQTAVAEFDYEMGLSPRRVAFLPDQLFYTSEGLDFTVVACDTSAIGDVDPIPLRRTPIEVMPRERVNIIQHPAGRPKEVVLHDNAVTRITQNHIYYRTDTEGGSSGSPVFDNQWELVGLHHWGRQDGVDAENRAIRLAAIISHLRGLSGGSEAAVARRVIGDVTGTNPLLGFFDTVASYGDNSQAVETPGFTGTREFVDLGFWNIEQFNDSVSDERVEDVAKVAAGLAMDTLGLVEAQRGALERLVAELRAHGLEMDFVQNEPGSPDAAVLFDTDTTKVQHRADLLERFDSLLSATIPEGLVFPRKLLFAECTVSQDDEPPSGEQSRAVRRYLKLVVPLKTSTSDAPSRARRRAAAHALREIIDTLRSDPNPLPIVLGGDVAEFLTNDVLSRLASSANLFALATADAVSGAASFIGGPNSRIDHIVVSDDIERDGIQGDDAAIVRLDRSIAEISKPVSDHVPVAFRLVFAGDGQGGNGGGDATVLTIPRGATGVRVSFVKPT